MPMPADHPLGVPDDERSGGGLAASMQGAGVVNAIRDVLEPAATGETDVAAMIRSEAETLVPLADVPLYHDGIDRVMVLRRYVHCNESLKRVPMWRDKDRTDLCVNYAVQVRETLPLITCVFTACLLAKKMPLLVVLQPHAIEELGTEMNNNLLVSALLVTVSLGFQFGGFTFETHPDLYEPFLCMNSLTSTMYMVDIFLGIALECCSAKV